MKNIKYIFALLFLLGIYLYREIPPPEEPIPIITNSQNLIYNWDDDRYMSKQETDTLIFTAGRWYTKTQVKSLFTNNKPYHSTEKHLKWIHPVNKESTNEKLWLKQQQQDQIEKDREEPLTEEDVINLIEY